MADFSNVRESFLWIVPKFCGSLRSFYSNVMPGGTGFCKSPSGQKRSDVEVIERSLTAELVLGGDLSSNPPHSAYLVKESDRDLTPSIRVFRIGTKKLRKGMATGVGNHEKT